MFLQDISKFNPVPFVYLLQTEDDPDLSIYQNLTEISQWSKYEATAGNRSLKMVSSSFLKESHRVTDLVSEVIQVWHHEEFLFLWSCEELWSDMEHDEAALIPVNSDFPGKKEELKVVLPKYLGLSFWVFIDWKEMSPSEN